ncbi:hypothetical protein P4679_22180 [Priestia megaterium]|uniref:hypothetical protein n=1 Tax=Priestia megaterium TaxID=1404 RepID=UPI002E226D82|nr:hypothetical protein [Priestia megaterium]
MFEYKKQLVGLIEDNKELVKEYAVKLGLIKEKEETYNDLESRCYRVLAEYDRLIVYGIDGQPIYFKKLYERFKEDSRVQFWLSNEMRDLLPTEDENTWFYNEGSINPYSKPIFDYGEYRLFDKTAEVKKLALVDNVKQQDESIGFLPGLKKEKNLCKVVSKLIKEEKELTILTYDEKTLLYLKGVMKGAGLTNRSITFAFLDVYQQHLIDSFKSEMYFAVPVVTVEEDANWSELIRKWHTCQREINESIKKHKNK